jgi:hypothetical protein
MQRGRDGANEASCATKCAAFSRLRRPPPPLRRCRCVGAAADCVHPAEFGQLGGRQQVIFNSAVQREHRVDAPWIIPPLLKSRGRSWVEKLIRHNVSLAHPGAPLSSAAMASRAQADHQGHRIFG